MDDKRQTHHLIQSIRQEKGEVRTYFLRWGLLRQSFLPGQFSNVRLHRHPERVGALTFCTEPNADEFGFSVKNTGDFGGMFYAQASVGDALSLSAPAGPFGLRPAQEQEPLVFIGRDYCLPALRSFLLHLRKRAHNFRLTLLHEQGDPDCDLYADELCAWENDFFERKVFRRALQSGDLSELTDGHFFVQAEGADARRFRDLLVQAGIPRERTFIERWS